MRDGPEHQSRFIISQNDNGTLLSINEYYSKKTSIDRRLFCKEYYIYNRYKHVIKNIKKKG
jgi:hypothetical protein